MFEPGPTRSAAARLVAGWVASVLAASAFWASCVGWDNGFAFHHALDEDYAIIGVDRWNWKGLSVADGGVMRSVVPADIRQVYASPDTYYALSCRREGCAWYAVNRGLGARQEEGEVVPAPDTTSLERVF